MDQSQVLLKFFQVFAGLIFKPCGFETQIYFVAGRSARSSPVVE